MPAPIAQTIRLKPENVLEIAKHTLKPAGWKCEWIMASANKHSSSPATCSIVLQSWNAYLKHLLQHVQYQWSKTGKYSCCLTRCNLPLMGAGTTSFDQLKDHIENSHMSRAPLYCPLLGCENVAFSRGPSQLDNHFKETHRHLLNEDITLPSDLVLPMSIPYIPAALDLPPPLPLHPMPGCLIVPAVRGSRVCDVGGLSLSQASQGSPRKRLKLHQMPEEETSSETSIFFDDLEKQLDRNGQFIGTMGCILGRKVGPHLDVARPQPILDPAQFGLKSPPISIHYNVFSNRLDEMERAAATKVNVPIVPMQASSTMH